MTYFDEKRIDEIKRMREQFTTSMISRGGILDFAINVENTLTDLIAWCFFPTDKPWDVDIYNQLDENGLLLKSTILRKLMFVDKIEVFKSITKAKDLLPEHKLLLKETLKELDNVRTFRNLLAHCHLDVSVDSLSSLIYNKQGTGTDDFQIIEYRSGRTYKHKIDTNRIQKEMKTSARCLYHLLQLFALLKGDTEDARASELLANMTNEDLDLLLKYLKLNG